MKKKRSTINLRGACIVLTFLLGVFLAAAPAFAEEVKVTGADYFYATETDDATVDILTVTGEAGKTVYIKAMDGDKVIADRLAFTLNEEDGTLDDNNDVVGAVSVHFNAKAFQYDKDYQIEVYGNRAETAEDLMYSGTITTLSAKCGDNIPQALVTRTIGESDKDRPLDIPQTLEDSNGVPYKLSSETPQDVDGRQCYIYELSDEIADSVEAHINYYDSAEPTGEPVKTETFTLAKDASQDVPIESIIAGKDDTLYRTLTLAQKLTIAYPGTTEYTIMCKKLTGEGWGSVKSFYKATINYTDQDGKNLGLVDTVIVNKDYTYTAPNKLYIKDDEGTVKEYEIVDASKAVLQLKPGDSTEAKEYQIVYKPVEDSAYRTWTVVLENGSVSPKDDKRIIDVITKKGRPGDTAVYNTESKIEVDGVDYVPSAAAQETYTHTFGVADMDIQQTIYYVPDGYVAPEAYTITVKYVNIATNETIDSQTHTVSPTMRSDLEIETPASFSQGGIDWIRLNGQEYPIRHGFYAGAREYVVYYRDVNDDLHANTIIRTVRTVYVDEEGNTIVRPTTVVDNGTVTTTEAGDATEAAADADGNAAADGAAQAAAAQANLATDGNLLAIDGADGQELVTEDGTDTATMRIDDDTTPLAGPGKEAQSKIDYKVLAAGGVVAAAAAGLILFFIHKRRKNSNEESSEDDQTA